MPKAPTPPAVPAVPTESPSRSPLAQNELVPADDVDHDSQGDADSSLGTDAESSTTSVSTSILKYRRSQGRMYHSDKFTSNYFFPNDDQQLESMDLTCGFVFQCVSMRS
ncbi:hypothetical protein H9Q72_012635 [Fusarium xylarioides]|uniref:Uncharacterized protein n=1 Tax=Fusarium xylarioides TaxID=221167 RepID=A0A9P7HKJ3_9HYPO|nr:hypothetical protein H9Q72_012635 [Fusarium xylarioides]